MRRIAGLLAPFMLAAGLILGFGTVAAHASTGSGAQWRALDYTNEPFMNAWNGGGGYVNDYDSQAVNNDFTYFYRSDLGHYQIAFTPGNCNLSNNNCLVISDYQNQSGSARAGTYTNFNGAPWGSLFDIGNCTAQGASGHTFRDVHWGLYLDPSGIGNNGSPIYLNGSPAYCWVSYPPA